VLQFLKIFCCKFNNWGAGGGGGGGGGWVSKFKKINLKEKFVKFLYMVQVGSKNMRPFELFAFIFC